MRLRPQDLDPLTLEMELLEDSKTQVGGKAHEVNTLLPDLLSSSLADSASALLDFDQTSAPPWAKEDEPIQRNLEPRRNLPQIELKPALLSSYPKLKILQQ